jgi:catalase-peroxidase
MGPVSRYLGPEVPEEKLIWQDPLPSVEYSAIEDSDVSTLKSDILSAEGLDVSKLVATAWASASTFRFSDKRGGANGGRIALDPQRSWEANNPEQLEGVLSAVSASRTGIGDIY